MRILLLLLSALTINAHAQPSMIGSAHDFSTNEQWNYSGESCSVCHEANNEEDSPHAPLWNRSITTATFITYSGGSSSTFDGHTTQPDGNTLLCLGCHDGSLALDVAGVSTITAVYMTGSALIGVDLSDDHPVSFAYDAALASTDKSLYNPDTRDSGLGGSITEDLLFAGKMQCSSCHDVHNAGGHEFLLRISNDGSKLCITCHNK